VPTRHECARLTALSQVREVWWRPARNHPHPNSAVCWQVRASQMGWLHRTSAETYGSGGMVARVRERGRTVCTMGLPPFYGKWPHRLLWADSWAPQRKVISGTLNCLNNCETVLVYTRFMWCWEGCKKSVGPIVWEKKYYIFQTFAVFWMLYAFFWVIHQRLYFKCQPFGTFCLFHLHRPVSMN
jgi:hypothetical protein